MSKVLWAAAALSFAEGFSDLPCSRQTSMPTQKRPLYNRQAMRQNASALVWEFEWAHDPLPGTPLNDDGGRYPNARRQP